MFRKDSAVDAECILGLVNQDGPLHIDRSVDPELVRYLVNLVQSSLPPPAVVPQTAIVKGDMRQSLGFGLGRRNQNDISRKSSWSSLGWVPGLGSATSRSPASGASSVTHPSDRARAPTIENSSKRSRETKPRWPSLGLGGLSGLGEAMGSVSTALGMRTSPRSDPAAQLARSASPAGPSLQQSPREGVQADCLPSVLDGNSQLGISEQATRSPGDQMTSTGQEDAADEGSETSTSNDPNVQLVKQSLVALPDLRAAVQADSQIELTWDGRGVWFRPQPDDDDAYIKRRLTWILVRLLVLSSHISG